MDLPALLPQWPVGGWPRVGWAACGVHISAISLDSPFLDEIFPLPSPPLSFTPFPSSSLPSTLRFLSFFLNLFQNPRQSHLYLAKGKPTSSGPEATSGTSHKPPFRWPFSKVEDC